MCAVWGIRIAKEIDVTGIATVILALATAGLALWTRKAVKQGSIEVDRAHRPVLVPIIDGSQNFQAWGHGVMPLGPGFDPQDRTVFVPVRNVGMGPALDVAARIDPGDALGLPSAAGMQASSDAVVGAISHGAPWFVFPFATPHLANMMGFAISIEYSDVAGMRWKTTARYSLSDQRYFDLNVESP
ncbi:MAG: hypothetical protein V7607_4848 [Solirubrobacteraceae bacterium]